MMLLYNCLNRVSEDRFKNDNSDFNMFRFDSKHPIVVDETNDNDIEKVIKRIMKSHMCISPKLWRYEKIDNHWIVIRPSGYNSYKAIKIWIASDQEELDLVNKEIRIWTDRETHQKVAILTATDQLKKCCDKLSELIKKKNKILKRGVAKDDGNKSSNDSEKFRD